MSFHSALLLNLFVGSTLGVVSLPVNAPEMSHPAISSVNTALIADNSQLTSVGGPLAQELQGKPVVVDVYATWCAGCKNIEGTLSQLKQDYAEKVNFVVLDVSDRGKVKSSTAMAEKLGLGEFLEATKSKTSTVAIIDPATGDILAMYKNNPNIEDYRQVLNANLPQ
ncbi:MAG: thioredoxin family protein [Cyanobacteria bacterium P01_H01_bin.15]